MTVALEGGEWSAARPGRTLPPGKNRYPFYRRLGGPQGRSGQAENLVPTGILSRTVQPIVSRYTDWATEPTILLGTLINYVIILCLCVTCAHLYSPLFHTLVWCSVSIIGHLAIESARWYARIELKWTELHNLKNLYSRHIHSCSLLP